MPEGYKRSYAYVFNPHGEVVISKWWMTQSCEDAYERERQAKLERFAMMREASRAKKAEQEAAPVVVDIRRRCPECQKPGVLTGRQKYCDRCLLQRKRESDRRHIARKRANVGKFVQLAA